MASSEVTVIDLQLNTEEAIASSSELSDILAELKAISANVGAAISKAFTPVLSSLKKVQTGIDNASAAMSNLAGSMSEVKSTAEESTDTLGLVVGITTTCAAIDQLFAKINETENFSGKLQGLFEELVTAPNMGNLLKSMFPKSAELFSTMSQWTNDNVISAIAQSLGTGAGTISNGMTNVVNSITSVFKGIGSAFSGMSLGWGAVIAGIIALIVLLVTNWDMVKAAVISAWETIMGALSTAAEWLNTTVIQPIVGFVTGLWDSISGIVGQIWAGVVSVFSTAAQWVYDNVLQPIIDFFAPIVDWFAQLFGSIFQTVSDVFYNIGVIISGCWQILVAVWGVVSEWFNENVIQPVAEFFSGLWNSISSWAVNAWNSIVAVFTGIAVWFYQNVTQPITGFFAGLWEGFANAAKQAWEGVKTVFSKVAGFFKDIFSKAWAGIVNVFSAAGDIFVNIKDGILTAFKSIVNGLIAGLNTVISIPFKGINSAIGFIRDITILDITPFSGLQTIHVPQIPYLAKGAVLPANRPFLAVVGDQRHGTNVEAPLSTIQEAVAVVMDDHIAAMMAGFEALLAEQRATRQTIEGIQIGDTVIGRAVDRYRSKMAVVYGTGRV